MANTTRANNAQDTDQDQLRGGTQGGGAPPTNVGGPSGGTNSVSPTGASQPDRGPAAPPGGGVPDQRGTANEAKQDAEAAFEDGHMQPSPQAKSRRPSATEAKQWARDDANADTTPGTPYGGVAPDRQVHKMQEDKD
jgi:hypothetical protein